MKKIINNIKEYGISIVLYVESSKLFDQLLVNIKQMVKMNPGFAAFIAKKKAGKESPKEDKMDGKKMDAKKMAAMKKAKKC